METIMITGNDKTKTDYSKINKKCGFEYYFKKSNFGKGRF